MNTTAPTAPANLTALEWALLIVERDAFIIAREQALVTYGHKAFQDDVVIMLGDDALEHEDEASQLGASVTDIARAFTTGSQRGFDAGKANDHSLPAEYTGI